MLKEAKIDTYIDIGAHHGEFILKLRRLGINSKVFAIEPSSEANKVLVNSNFKNIKVFKLGISNNFRTAKLFESGSPFASIKPILNAGILDQTYEEIELITLDSFVNENLKADFQNLCLKIDVQGSELEVLEGAVEVLRNTSIVFMEAPLQDYYSDFAQLIEILKYMKECGFQVAAIHTPRFSNGFAIDCDVIFVNQSRI